MKSPYQIPASKAFTEGAELWLVSDPEHSPWNHKIDWYLGFWLRRHNLNQKTPTPDPKMQALLKKYQLPHHLSLLNKPQPFLLESSSKLPNLWTIELVYTTKWLQKVHSIWENLNCPSLRIFIPTTIKPEEVKQQWVKQDHHFIQYVI